MDRFVPRLGKMLVVLAVLLGVPGTGNAQTADMYKDHIRTWSTISPLPEAAFGERYDLYKSELSRCQQDLR